MTQGGATFRLEDVTVQYPGIAALEGVDLEIGAGEAVAFVGPSGAGKTTLLRLLAGTITPSRGRVLRDGVDLATVSRRARRRLRAEVGFVYQDLDLVPNVRVLQNVLSGRLGRLSFLRSLCLMLWPPAPLVEEAHVLLDRVGIEEKLFERTDRLSGGQQQRVAVARALFQAPHALLADEPVSSVDPARARDTVALLTQLSEERGLTLATSLHHLDLARAFFPRLVGLRAGRVVFDRPTAEIEAEAFRDLYALERREMLADGA